MRPTIAPLLALVCLVSAVPAARASEEEYLQWRTVRVECEESSQAGKVGIVAAVKGNVFSRCELEAFGKTHAMKPDDLTKLEGFPLQDLRITHEAGYPQLGGHTVHFKFRRVSYDTVLKRPIIDEVVVSVSKGKGLEVGPIRQK